MCVVLATELLLHFAFECFFDDQMCRQLHQVTALRFTLNAGNQILDPHPRRRRCQYSLLHGKFLLLLDLMRHYR